jgi:hypothetical protein
MMQQKAIDGGEFLSEGVLEALANPSCFHMNEDHAILGRPQHKAIQLRALAGNQAMVILVDFGSSHIFLSSIVVTSHS